VCHFKLLTSVYFCVGAQAPVAKGLRVFPNTWMYKFLASQHATRNGASLTAAFALTRRQQQLPGEWEPHSFHQLLKQGIFLSAKRLNFASVFFLN